jgi:NDP-sugar pyrophosphorylase family protein
MAQIVIPMAGAGDRFARAGYAAPKPLIEVDGRPLIEHVVGQFPGESGFVFICAQPHLLETPLRAVLEALCPHAVILGIPPHKLGPVHSVLAAAGHIRDDEPVIVNYCDFGWVWDYADFKRCLAERDPAGCITAYRGFHPHSLGPNLYAYLRERDGYLVEIREKGCFTGDRMQEYGSAGTYYFRSGRLLKDTFSRAVERGLQTNGEFYASSPYNLLVEAGLPVLIYELERFLQWGTPEDLEEYQAWSDYFANWSDWRPSLPAAPGTLLVPMAGEGARFRRQGYTDPKPLVPVAGRPMLTRSTETLPPMSRSVALARAQLAADPRLAGALRAGGCHAEVVPITAPTSGQASTCLVARTYVDPNAPLLIAPCDTALVYDAAAFAGLIDDPEVDCVVWTFRNHPHANRHPAQYGWVRASVDGRVLGVSVKQPLDGDVRGHPGIVGAFWFRRAGYFFEAAEALIAQDRRVNGEFYVDSAIGTLLEQGRRARIFGVRHYICFGTPDDVRTFEYWERHFRAAAHHPYGKRGRQ